MKWYWSLVTKDNYLRIFLVVRKTFWSEDHQSYRKNNHHRHRHFTSDSCCMSAVRCETISDSTVNWFTSALKPNLRKKKIYIHLACRWCCSTNPEKVIGEWKQYPVPPSFTNKLHKCYPEASSVLIRRPSFEEALVLETCERAGFLFAFSSVLLNVMQLIQRCGDAHPFLFLPP